MIFNRSSVKVIAPKERSYLALDIGTVWIKTVLFIVNSDNCIEIIGYNRKHQKEGSMYAAFIINLKEVTETLDKSIGEVIAQAKEIHQDEFEMPKKAFILMDRLDGSALGDDLPYEVSKIVMEIRELLA